MASSPTKEPAESSVPPASDAKPSTPISDEIPEENGAKESEPAASSPHSASRAESPAKDQPEEQTTDEQSAEKQPATEQPAEKPADDAASPPPLPDEPPPDEQQQQQSDDGWDPVWSDEHQAWYFYNRFTQQTQWDNPRVPSASASVADASAVAVTAARVAGGYNPAIHGDYDPTAWYATGGVDPGQAQDQATAEAVDPEAAIAAAAAAAAVAIQNAEADFGRGHLKPHDAKANTQLNAYFDVAAVMSEHDGRSLKAERSGKKPTKAELKAFKERRRAKKEEKRRAWLRD